MVAALWLAAALRNFFVRARRALWPWMARLNTEPMTAERLSDRLATARSATGGLSVAPGAAMVALIESRSTKCLPG